MKTEINHSPAHFYMPAEWHPHTCCWMAWPARADSWPFELDRARASWVNAMHAIAQFEPVKVITPPDQVTVAKNYCGNGVEIIPLPIDDIWLRDTGPTFVIDGHGQIAGVDWQFNAWGENREKLEDYLRDAELAQRILEYTHLPRQAAPLILEGGSIHVDGMGTLLTTEECLLNANRNPQLSRQEIEELLRQYLGVTQIIWLGQGLQDDETAGHIDNLAGFARPGVVLALTCQDPLDSNYAILQDNLQRLRQAKDAQGRRLEIIELEQPSRRDDFNGLRLTTSYINFYLANGGIILPTFEDPVTDQQALNTFRQVFPNYQIVTIDGLDLVYGCGCVHCMTQQQPVPVV